MLEQMQVEAVSKITCSTEPINVEIQNSVCNGMPLLNVNQTSLGCTNACGTVNKPGHTQEKCTCVWENFKSPCINQQEVKGTKVCLWDGYQSPAVEPLLSSQSSDTRQHIIKEGHSDKKKSGLRARKRHGVSGTQMSVAKRTKLLKTKHVSLVNEHDENNHLLGAVVANTGVPDLSRIGSPERTCILVDAEKKANGTLPAIGIPSLKSVAGGGNSSICSVTIDSCSAIDSSLNENGQENLLTSVDQIECLKTELLVQSETTEVLALKSGLELPLAEEVNSLTDGSCRSIPDAVVSSDSLSDADRQGLNDRPPEQQQTTELDVDDLFLMPLVSKRSSRQLRRTSLQLYRKSREKDLASEPFSEGKWSGVNEQDKDMRNNENCTEDISSKPDIPPKSVQSSEQQDALSPRKNTSYQTHKVAKQRKRKNLHSLPHEDKSDDVEIENVIASLAACSSGAESVVNASDLLPDMTVRLQSIEEYKEDPSTIAEKQDVCPAATYPLALSKFCEHTSVDSADSPTASTSGRPQRRCASQPPLYVESTVVTKGRRKKVGPSLEDIYCNRLWRTQMPKEKGWEPIPETPSPDPRTGVERVFATRKIRCVMKFDDVPNQTRLRQRRQKAVARGWKPLTKKRMAALDGLLAAKLAEVDQEIAVENTE